MESSLEPTKNELSAKPKTILIDMDGVLADFEGHFLSIWRQRYPEEFYVEIKDRKEFYITRDYPQKYKSKIHEIYAEKGFFLSLPPLPGAIEGVKYLKSKGHTIKFCTSPIDAYEHCVTEKYAWIEKHLGKEWTHHVILTKDKTYVVGDFLIDDKPVITGEYPTPLWTHIIFRAPYNQEVKTQPHTLLESWDKVASLFP